MTERRFAQHRSGQCRRCKGKRQIVDEEGILRSCPDCEGTGQDFDELDPQDDADFGHAMGLDNGD